MTNINPPSWYDGGRYGVPIDVSARCDGLTEEDIRQRSEFTPCCIFVLIRRAPWPSYAHIMRYIRLPKTFNLEVFFDMETYMGFSQVRASQSLE